MALIFEDAASLAMALARRNISAVELMAAAYDQIEAVNGTVNALVSLLPRDEALCLAARADAGAGGALHGVPLAVKDLANAAGFATSMGSPIFARAIQRADDVHVARLRAAGAIVIGKTNTPEFGLGSQSYNPVHGVTRNPWNLSRSSGGSSGGATVALATGMVPLADGSDMMGSLRNPAGWTNTYGLRPSWGLVPSEPRGDVFLHQLATVGPMGRSPTDVEVMLRVMAGRDLRQPHGTDLCEARTPVRLGWLGDWGGALPMEPGVLALCEAALRLFEDLGCSVESVAAPFDRDRLWESWITLRSWQVAASLAPIMRQPALAEQLKPEARWEAERGLALTAMEIHRASVTRSDWYAAAQELFLTYDALLMPTAQCFPIPAETHWPDEIAGVAMDTYHRWMEVTVAASILGLPVMAVPAGFSAQGLPMGLQIIGQRGADLGLIDLAKQWHGAAPWAARRPGLGSGGPASL